MSISRIYTPTVTDAIVEKIQSMIADGIYKPGEALLPERQLVKELKVSRASLRAALSALEAIGLIYSRQGGGRRDNAPLECTLRDDEFTVDAAVYGEWHGADDTGSIRG